MKWFIVLFLSCSFSYAQEIAITFDDAPTGDGPLFKGSERAGEILNHLKANQVKQAAFFVITSNIDEAGRERLKKYAAAGHLLANHTHTHTAIHRLGTSAYINEIIQADSVLRQFPGYAPWFRYPFLDEGRSISTRDSIRSALRDLKLSNGYVTVDNYDWYLNNLLRLAVEKNQKIDSGKLRSLYIDHLWNSILFYDAVGKKILGRSPRHVLLLHENDMAALYLGDLLKHLKKMGWRIITPTAAYEDEIARHIPDVLMNGQGRVAAIAKEKGVPGRDLVQASEDEEFLRTLVEEKKVFR